MTKIEELASRMPGYRMSNIKDIYFCLAFDCDYYNIIKCIENNVDGNLSKYRTKYKNLIKEIHNADIVDSSND